MIFLTNYNTACQTSWSTNRLESIPFDSKRDSFSDLCDMVRVTLIGRKDPNKDFIGNFRTITVEYFGHCLSKMVGACYRWTCRAGTNLYHSLHIYS